ncbi:MAG: polyprenyl synthetase family protein [Akkermansiaceae bacterium]|nr:polyprenyl synthetase family protein [Akkermansiaceae bacterium]NNM30855.1 polyprenyl synthetase family protein [Akkermansiaceae bacterium]
MSDLKAYLNHHRREVDAALRSMLPRATTRPATVHKAMRYSVFAGGKRLRPILTLAAAEACEGDPGDALRPACAVEMIHTYSLIHDDLPCMDDDDLRRGRPTSHKVFGEGIAVLAGDALLTEAFAVLAGTPETKRHATRHYLAELAAAAGSKELIGGQVLDLEGEGHDLTRAQLVRIHEAKTAALLTASVRLGGMTANATPHRMKALTAFGRNLGLAFQVIDDILDVTQSTEQLGKTAGKDADAGKATYPAILGLEASRAEARRLTQKALSALKPFRRHGHRLEQIARYLLDREY